METCTFSQSLTANKNSCQILAAIQNSEPAVNRKPYTCPPYGVCDYQTFRLLEVDRKILFLILWFLMLSMVFNALVKSRKAKKK